MLAKRWSADGYTEVRTAQARRRRRLRRLAIGLPAARANVPRPRGGAFGLIAG